MFFYRPTFARTSVKYRKGLNAFRSLSTQRSARLKLYLKTSADFLPLQAGYLQACGILPQRCIFFGIFCPTPSSLTPAHAGAGVSAGARVSAHTAGICSAEPPRIFCSPRLNSARPSSGRARPKKRRYYSSENVLVAAMLKLISRLACVSSGKRYYSSKNVLAAAMLKPISGRACVSSGKRSLSPRPRRQSLSRGLPRR